MNQDQVSKCIKDFLETDRVKEAIATITKCKITGWEGWLQVEFAHYLETVVYGEQERKFDWYREYQINTHSSPNDEESEEKNKYIIPDFWISSDQGDDSYYLIEFKRSNSGSLPSDMEKDITKWKAHIGCYKGALECASEPGKAYKNCGVFFVGVETNPSDLRPSIKKNKVALELFEVPLEEGQLYYRIGFLPIEIKVTS
jgi:hypothetical protein